MGFCWPNMALTNPWPWIRPNIWSHFERENRRERRGRRRREEGEKFNQDQKGMELTLDMNSSMNHMGFVGDSRKVYEFQT